MHPDWHCICYTLHFKCKYYQLFSLRNCCTDVYVVNSIFLPPALLFLSEHPTPSSWTQVITLCQAKQFLLPDCGHAGVNISFTQEGKWRGNRTAYDSNRTESLLLQLRNIQGEMVYLGRASNVYCTSTFRLVILMICNTFSTLYKEGWQSMKRKWRQGKVSPKDRTELKELEKRNWIKFSDEAMWYQKWDKSMNMFIITLCFTLKY